MTKRGRPSKGTDNRVMHSVRLEPKVIRLLRSIAGALKLSQSDVISALLENEWRNGKLAKLFKKTDAND